MRTRIDRIYKTACKRAIRASALVEIQMAMAVLVLVFGATAGAHFFGLRMFFQTRQSIESSDEARKVLSNLREEIKGCTIVEVGNGTHLNFKDIPDDTPQVGNALRIFPGTNTGTYVIYFRDPYNAIHRWSTDTKRIQTLAHNVTNEMIFKATDFAGNTLTNSENNRVIEIGLKFLQEHSENAAKNGGLHNFYQVETKATRRVL
jgi:hypothetical protein